MLACAEEVAITPQAKVGSRDLESIRSRSENPEPFGRGSCIVQHDAIALIRTPSHSAAELVELRETETLGAFNHHHAGVRHVDADLDDRR